MVNNFTQILQSIEHGNPNAAEKLLPLVYEELRRLAAQRMSRESSDHTLQPTALVHEAWLKLAGGDDVHWNGRAHFFGAAAEAMRRILIDRARRKGAQRHGAGRQRIDLDDAQIANPVADEKLLAVNDALDELATHDPAKAELVKLRYFAGLTIDEAAKVLDISEATAKRHWIFAKAWLHRQIASDSQR